MRPEKGTEPKKGQDHKGVKDLKRGKEPGEGRHQMGTRAQTFGRQNFQGIWHRRRNFFFRLLMPPPHVSTCETRKERKEICQRRASKMPLATLQKRKISISAVHSRETLPRAMNSYLAKHASINFCIWGITNNNSSSTLPTGPIIDWLVIFQQP